MSFLNWARTSMIEEEYSSAFCRSTSVPDPTLCGDERATAIPVLLERLAKGSSDDDLASRPCFSLIRTRATIGADRMEMILQDCSRSLFHTSQQWSTRSCRI